MIDLQVLDKRCVTRSESNVSEILTNLEFEATDG